MKNTSTSLDFDISVIILAYNSEQYIGQCLQSVFDQRFDGTVEISVWDDASTDQTKNIVEGFNSQCDNWKRLIYAKNDINNGAWLNFVKAQQHARGKYVSYLEADDFWLDPNKLQDQFNYLEKDRNAWGVASRCQFVDSDGNAISNAYFNSDVEHQIGLKDCWYYPSFQASTLMFRNTVNFSSYQLNESNILNDKRLYLLGCRQGYIQYKPNNTSAYRMHSSNLTSRTTDINVLFQHLRCNLFFLRLYGLTQFNLYLKGSIRMVSIHVKKRLAFTFNFIIRQYANMVSNFQLNKSDSNQKQTKP